jgi:hypothetical protein
LGRRQIIAFSISFGCEVNLIDIQQMRFGDADGYALDESACRFAAANRHVPQRFLVRSEFADRRLRRDSNGRETK